jgi:hypothetical protein
MSAAMLAKHQGFKVFYFRARIFYGHLGRHAADFPGFFVFSHFSLLQFRCKLTNFKFSKWEKTLPVVHVVTIIFVPQISRPREIW